MTFFQIFKCIFVLPFAWLDSITCRNKTLEERYLKAQKWSKFMIGYLGYDLEVEGVENIPTNEAIYFVSNHQGTLDPALVVASSPVPLGFISKKENEKMPIFGRWARNLNTIHFDRDTREGNVFMLREAARNLKAKQNLLIFPEGTRSKGDKMNEFKLGALQPAYLGKATLVPVTLNNAYCIDDKKDKNKKLKITYGKAIPYEEYKQYKHPKMTQIMFDKVESNVIYH